MDAEEASGIVHAPNEIESRARDFYAAHCAGGHDGSYPAWDQLPFDVREQWKVVAMRAMALLLNALFLNSGKGIGPYELGHRPDMDDRIVVWRQIVEK